MRTRPLQVLMLIVAIAPVSALAGEKADRRLLQRIERVDGAGSGLDADTVRGMTPDQMMSALDARLQTLQAQVDGLSGFDPSKLYTHASRVLQASGTERFVSAACDQPGDLVINCSGGAYDGSTAFPITWMGVMRPEGQAEECVVVVGAGATTPNLEAQVRCLRVP
jgi:hypothetical protein